MRGTNYLKKSLSLLCVFSRMGMSSARGLGENNVGLWCRRSQDLRKYPEVSCGQNLQAAPRRPPCRPSSDLNSCNAQIEVGPESRRPPRSSGNTRKTPTFFVWHMSASLRNQETTSSRWFDAATFEERVQALQPKMVLFWTEMVAARTQNVGHDTMSRLRAISRSR